MIARFHWLEMSDIAMVYKRMGQHDQHLHDGKVRDIYTIARYNQKKKNTHTHTQPC